MRDLVRAVTVDRVAPYRFAPLSLPHTLSRLVVPAPNPVPVLCSHPFRDTETVY
jgi:hypothetical protein